MEDYGDAICVIGQKIKNTSELDMGISNSRVELRAYCAELISLIDKVG